MTYQDSGPVEEEEKLEEEYLKECAEHERMSRWVGRLAVACAVLVVLLAVSLLVVWRLLS